METIGSKRSYALIWCMPNNAAAAAAAAVVRQYTSCPVAQYNQLKRTIKQSNLELETGVS